MQEVVHVDPTFTARREVIKAEVFTVRCNLFPRRCRLPRCYASVVAHNCSIDAIVL